MFSIVNCFKGCSDSNLCFAKPNISAKINKRLVELDVDFLAINAQSASRARIRKTQGREKQIMVWI